jgi:hypothetical protein
MKVNFNDFNSNWAQVSDRKGAARKKELSEGLSETYIPSSGEELVFPKHISINFGKLHAEGAVCPGLGKIDEICLKFPEEIKENHKTAISESMMGTGTLGWVIANGNDIKPGSETGDVRPANIQNLFDKYWDGTSKNHMVSLVQTGAGLPGTIAINDLPWDLPALPVKDIAPFPVMPLEL